MFVHDFVYVDLPASVVRLGILSEGGRWLSPLAAGAAEDGRAVLVRIGPLPHHPLLSKTARVEAAAPDQRGDVTVVPLTWTATGSPGAFPVLHADLEVAPIGEGRTQLSLRGRYEPPLGALGRRLDTLLFHRVAEACVRSFLQRMRDALSEQPPPSAARDPRATAGSGTA